MTNSAPFTTTQEKADAFDSFFEVFVHLFRDLKAMGNKKPTETLNESKVVMINRILKDMQECMTGEPEHKYLDLLDSETLPQYSDTILILAQYEGALKGFKEKHFGWDNVEHKDRWFIEIDDDS